MHKQRHSHELLSAISNRLLYAERYEPACKDAAKEARAEMVSLLDTVPVPPRKL